MEAAALEKHRMKGAKVVRLGMLALTRRRGKLLLHQGISLESFYHAC